MNHAECGMATALSMPHIIAVLTFFIGLPIAPVGCKTDALMRFGEEALLAVLTIMTE